jgi:hypothetical protein
VRKAARLKSTLPTHWNLIGSSMGYHPAVFFRHLRLTALSFPKGKIWRAFQTYYFSFFTIYKIL